MENNADLVLEFQTTLKDILTWWMDHTVDREHGGFHGRITNDNEVVKGAVKGSVLNARILWSFSAGYLSEGEGAYLSMAERAFNYIRKYFVDEEYGGVYWSISEAGAPVDTKKQIYAIAFTIFGLTEYYRARPDKEVLELAKQLYQSIEEHSYDKEHGGYEEALTREWRAIADLRLSEKDANEKKTMNTHLHILEAYTNLYRIWQDGELAGKIRGLIKNFTEHIVDGSSHHLRLFFGEDWEVRSNIVSYGHDIEASWLLMEAAEVLEDAALVEKVRKTAIAITRASEEGMNTDGSMSYELEGDHLVKERHWWVQAEAMVGFLDTWKLTGEDGFYERFLHVWDYVRTYIIDGKRGEWFWGRTADGIIMEGEDKAGFWKCPYHNSRACIEVLRRLTSAATI